MNTLDTMTNANQQSPLLANAPGDRRLNYLPPSVERLGVSQATEGNKIPGYSEGSDHVITFGS